MIHLLITFSVPRDCFLLWLHYTERVTWKRQLFQSQLISQEHFDILFPGLNCRHVIQLPRAAKAAKEIILPFPLWLGNLQVCFNHRDQVTNSLYITCSLYLYSCNIRCWVAWEAALETFNEAKGSARPLTNSFLTNKIVQLLLVLDLTKELTGFKPTKSQRSLQM